MKAIEVKGLKKKYRKTEALKGVSFEVDKGELFGIIGPDGAGKTTLFRILTTLIYPDEGEARVEGLDTIKDYKEIRHIVGYMPGRFSLYQDLSVEENLTFFATVFNTTIEENYHLIEDIYKQIEPFKRRKAGKLSGGMKQKLALSCALIHKPKVLFLDEPTTGVDPVSRKEFWGMLKKLKKEGITIIVSTPYMDEAMLCDRIALISEGEIMKINSPEGIISEYDSRLWKIRGEDMHRLLKDVREYEGTESCYAFGDSLHITLKGGEESIGGLEKFAEEKGHGKIRGEEIRANIEDCFMKLMKK